MAKKNTNPTPWANIEARCIDKYTAGEILGLAESRVRDYCRDGTLRAFSLGRVWVIDRLSAEELAAERAE